MKRDVSNEILGAYVDNELACSEKRSVAEEIKADAELEQHAQAILDLKTSIKKAYPDDMHKMPGAEVNDSPDQASKRIFRQSIAASFILTCGLIVGAMINLSDNSINKVSSASNANNQLFGINVKPVTQHDDKILLHIASADLKKIDFLLTKTERLLTDSRHSQHPINIEVIANSKGVDFLRTSTSPYAQRIKELQQKYSNLQFIACKNTLRRLQEKDQSVQILEGVKADKPALDTIINRMDKGWTYIKI